MTNLLQFAERDISNAIMEWTDIIPEVEKREWENALLIEKDLKIKIAEQEQEKLKNDLEEQKNLLDSVK